MFNKIPFLFLLLLVSCSVEGDLKSPAKDGICFTESNPPESSDKVTIEQGLWGDVWFWKGDFMPVNRGEICRVERRIYIYELTNFEQVEKVGYTPFYTRIFTNLVTTTSSDTYGFFQVELDPGVYSIFIKEGEEYYANLFTGDGNIFEVSIEEGKTTGIQFDITYQATF